MKKILSMAAAAVAILAASCAQAPEASSSHDDAPVCDSAAVITNIMTRTSIRQFTDSPIPTATMETILHAGMAAPTAMNKQPWEFVVVTDRAILDSLITAHPYSNLKTATAAIIVCGNMQKAIDGNGRPFWIQDCSAATENILLAAHACGLGAVWCGVYPSKERVEAVSSVLGLPSYVEPLSLVAMGYPADSPEPKDKWNPEAVHSQHW